MKKINRTILGVAFLALGVPSLVSCIEETEPMNGYATTKQIERSPSATKALANALPAYFNYVWNRDVHYSFGYGAVMHIRDVMTADMAIAESNYDQFSNYEKNTYLGTEYRSIGFIWNYYYGFILAANSLIGGVNPENATSEQLGYLGTGHAFRALCYLDLARMYEFLPNDQFTDGKNEAGNVVTNLTVPIVTDQTSEQDARNTPRATRDQMKEFILSDLNKAEQYIGKLTDTSGKIMPDSACVLGLKARFYMWIEDYPHAQEYAHKAINASKLSPMTQEQALNTTTGFNVNDPWMWGAKQTSDDTSVKTSIINWTSFASNETSFGYAGGGGVYSMIGRAVYDRISDTDWRKLEWKAPAGSALADKVSFLRSAYKQQFPTYASVKFRPGNGDDQESSIGAATCYPIMRVEEMYFIEAEAAAHQNAATGKQLLETFMKSYRDPNYTTSANTKDEIIEEIVFQKRVELWGEGQSFYDIKRLNYSVTRSYQGNNFYELCRFNTNGRPAWMNIVISRNETNNNPTIVNYNNPNPSDKYTPAP